MSLLDTLTGGEDSAAAAALAQAQNNMSAIQAPTAQALSLPELEKYAIAAHMTPAQMQAFLQQNNAFDSAKFDPASWSAQVGALNQLGSIADSGEKGTPEEQAAFARAEQDSNRTLAGQRGAIEQDAESRGIPASLLASATAMSNAGQDAQTQHMTDLNASSEAYKNAIAALGEEGTLGGQMQTQQQGWQSAVANAANAMQQFNANNQTNASATNAGLTQDAGKLNTAIANDTANKNTELANTRTTYNAAVPQTVFNDQMAKATGQAGVAANQANQSMQAGQQQAGLIGGVIGAGSTLAGNYLAGNTMANALAALSAGKSAAPSASNNGMTQNAAEGGIMGHSYCLHEGGLCLEKGGLLPGHAQVPGNSETNDVISAKLSPGEAVIPRTAVQSHLPEVMSLIGEGRHATGGNGVMNAQPVGAAGMELHPSDIAALLKAMHSLRTEQGRTF